MLRGSRESSRVTSGFFLPGDEVSGAEEPPRWRVGHQSRFFRVKMDNLTDLKLMLGHRWQPLAFNFER